MAEDRITRTCDDCQASDNHAHHIQYAAILHPVTKEPVDFSVSKHIQCCAAAGCEICKTDLEFAPSVVIGDDFNAYAQAKSPEHLAALSERHGISVPEGD